MCTMSLQNTSAISTKNCGKTVGNNPAEQGTIPHFCFKTKKNTRTHTISGVYLVAGVGFERPCQKHSRLGHSAQLVPDTPCFFPCRARFTVHRTRSRSKPTPSSGGRGGGQFHLSVETKENRPNRVCFFYLARGTQKDTAYPFPIEGSVDFTIPQADVRSMSA